MMFQKRLFYAFIFFLITLFCVEIGYIYQNQRDIKKAKELINLVGIYDLPIWLNHLHVRHRTLKRSEDAFDWHPGFRTKDRASFVILPLKEKI